MYQGKPSPKILLSGLLVAIVLLFATAYSNYRAIADARATARSATHGYLAHTALQELMIALVHFELCQRETLEQELAAPNQPECKPERLRSALTATDDYYAPGTQAYPRYQAMNRVIDERMHLAATLEALTKSDTRTDEERAQSVREEYKLFDAAMLILADLQSEEAANFKVQSARSSARLIDAQDYVVFGNLLAVVMLVIAELSLREELTRRYGAERSLRDADARKDEYLAMLAHELRNPLAPIRNATEILRRLPRPEPEYSRLAEILRKQVQHLTHLVDELLDVARVTRGVILLNKELMSLRDTVTAAVELNRLPITDRRQQVILDLTQDVTVLGDSTRLLQAISNVVQNASQYTPEDGHIWVDLSHSSATAKLTVRDDGTGLEKELLPRVFDLFVQGQRRLDRRSGGLGMGLALTRRLVEMHGGFIVAASAGPGKGSEFVITLPVVTDQDVAPDSGVIS